jgi:hypothetical protein
MYVDLKFGRVLRELSACPHALKEISQRSASRDRGSLLHPSIVILLERVESVIQLVQSQCPKTIDRGTLDHNTNCCRSKNEVR